MDTVVQEGIFAIRKPDAIYRTPSELILYYDGVLYTYSSGSDVGTKTEMEQFLYADIGTLLEHLEEDFELTYSKDQEELVLSGKAGDGNITEFTVFIDDEYVPHEIRWIDIFGYNTVLQFENISFGEPGDIFSPPEDIEFIEQ